MSIDLSKYAGHTFAPGYSVTPEGLVYSFGHRWRGKECFLLDQTPNSHGYPSVRIVVGAKRSRKLVHKLVAEAFLGPRPSPAHEVRHLDGDRTNNNAWNLSWGTRMENAEDRARHGRTSHGRSHSDAIKRGLPAALALRPSGDGVGHD